MSVVPSSHCRAITLGGKWRGLEGSVIVFGIVPRNPGHGLEPRCARCGTSTEVKDGPCPLGCILINFKRLIHCAKVLGMDL